MRIVVAMLGLGVLAWASMLLTSEEAVAAKPECQTMSVHGPNGPRDALMCKDGNGRWYEASAPNPAPASIGYPGALPSKARVSYKGEYSITVKTPMQFKRNTSIFDMVRGGDGNKIQGAVSYDLVVDGSSITGTSSTSADNWRVRSITGTVKNGYCKLFDTDAITEGTCDARGFSGTISSTGKGKDTVTGTFQADAVKVVDAVAEALDEHQRQAANKRQRAAEATAEAARIASLPAATRQQALLLAAAVTQDSDSWISNRYEPNSLTNVRISGKNSAQTTVRGEYRFNQNENGWVEGRIVDGQVECLQYWDTPSCSHVRVRLAAESRPKSNLSVSTPPKGQPLQILRWALAEDSVSWTFNELAANSSGPAIEQSGDAAAGKVFRMNYRYTNNSPGWIEGRFEGGELSAIRYHNFPHWNEVRTDDWRRRDQQRALNEEAKERARGAAQRDAWCASGANVNCR